jgi:two-component system, OmpR family, phosphate regulon sensor histidine kinase PhoR
MESVAGDQFILKISERGKVLYSTIADERPVKISRNIWLAPVYQLGILLQGTSIEELIQHRFITNLIIIIILSVILIAGLWIVFRNIKHELNWLR